MKSLSLILCFFCVYLVSVNAIDSLHPISNDFETMLPIVKVDLMGQSLSSEERILAKIQIIWNENGPNKITDSPRGNRSYDGWTAIRWRGAHSLGWEIKSYSLQMVDQQGNEITTPLLGFPEHDNFILKASGSKEHARSLYYLRDSFGFELIRTTMPRWAPRTQWAVLFVKFKSGDSLQTQYQGVYLGEESIKRSPYRVPIDKWDVDDVNRGYIMARGGLDEAKEVVMDIKECDGGDIGITYPKEATQAHADYLIGIWKKVCSASSGWENLLNVPSFVDGFLFYQFIKASDTMRHNSRWWKNTNGPINQGPIWDLDLGIRDDPEDWHPKWEESSEWVNLMTKHATFKSQLSSRWKQLRSAGWSDHNIFSIMKKIELTIGSDLEMQLLDKVDERFEELQRWLAERLQWIDHNIDKCCNLSNSSQVIKPVSRFFAKNKN